MKKILLTMAAVSALAAGAPAAAQFGAGGYGYAGISAQLGQLQTRLDAGVRAGTITRDDARRIDAQMRELGELERRYARGGIDARERADLQVRIRNLREQIRYAERYGQGRNGRDWDRDGRYGDRDGRYGDRYNDRCAVTADWIDRNRDGYDDRDLNRNGRWSDDAGCEDRDWRSGQGGRWDRDDRWDDRDDRYGDRVDRNRDGWDDRDYDRDGRWDDDVYQRDDRYEPRSRGGIGGVIDGILGGGSGLRVGQRVTGNLGAVPYEYRNQYRDGNGAYYRSDGRNIYQIDARTHTVVRIFPMGR